MRARRRLPLVLLACACLAGRVAPAGAQVTLRVATDHNPPLAYAIGGELFSGLAIDLLRRAAADAGVNIALQEMPWPRAFETYSHQPNACLIGLGRTPEREAQFVWVGPFARGGVVLFAPAGRQLALKSVDDVIKQGLVVGVAADDVAQGVVEHIAGLRVASISLQVTAPRMLEKGRFDLWASGAILGRYRAANLGVAVREALRLRDVDVALGCAPGTDPDAIRKLQAALDRLRAKGVAARYERAYLDNAPMTALEK
ncbi:MAG: transporter substrate-binding domain-containing protein [Pelomonas sp.]|nr:transporter substrate-binding domain-containing protein [Roseateles sp.]